MYDAGIAITHLIDLLNQLDLEYKYEIYRTPLYYRVYKNNKCVLKQFFNSKDLNINILCYLIQELYLKIG